MDNKELAATLLSTRAKFEKALNDVDDLNTDFIALQNDMDTLTATVNGYDARIAEAMQKADTAQNTANTAMSTADTALTHASEADDKAVSAQESATQAYDVAMAAQDQAQTAFTHASTAITDAGEAKTLAETKYEKPADGIPESDLTVEVQTKLNSASQLYRHSIYINGMSIDGHTVDLFIVDISRQESYSGMADYLSLLGNDGNLLIGGGKIEKTENGVNQIYNIYCMTAVMTEIQFYYIDKNGYDNREAIDIDHMTFQDIVKEV